jgi:hypothetical protein
MATDVELILQQYIEGVIYVVKLTDVLYVACILNLSSIGLLTRDVCVDYG